MTAQMAGSPLVAGFEVTAKGTQVKLSETLAIGKLDAHAAVARSAAAGARGDFASRSLQLDVEAADVKMPSGDVTHANASVAGTLAAHTVTIALDGGDIGFDAAAHGGLTGDVAKDAPTALGWAGTIDSLSGRGPWTLRLASPTTLSFARRKARLGETHLAVAEGTVDIVDFAWDEGKITSRGRFAALTVASIARLTGRPLPVPTTLTLGGEWSLAATPRLTGTVSVHREQGDLWLARESDAAGAGLAAGITELEASAQVRDDALQATAKFRSRRGGNGDATLTIGADPNAPPGSISPRAPLALTLVADLTSLAILQPWAGTTAWSTVACISISREGHGARRAAVGHGARDRPADRRRPIRASFQGRPHQRTSCQPPGHAGRARVLGRRRNFPCHRNACRGHGER